MLTETYYSKAISIHRDKMSQLKTMQVALARPAAQGRLKKAVGVEPKVFLNMAEKADWLA